MSQGHLKLIATARVDCAAPVMAGTVGGARRMMIALTGGSVTGQITGEVMNYGADWPLIHPDGRTIVEANYVIKASNGDLIQVRNTASIKGVTPGEPVWTRPEFTAPDGDHDWLNHGSYVGRLTANMGDGFVVVEFFQVEAG